LFDHGGERRAAAQQYGIDEADWLDLSTGINPLPWPVPELPGECWQRLPEDDPELMQVALEYYGCRELLPIAGSQAAIQVLPQIIFELRAKSRVGVLTPTYHEHQRCWQQAGHEVHTLSADAIESYISKLDVLVLVNPNNPDGSRFPRETLSRWRASLAARGGWLIVDEAYMDMTPQESMLSLSLPPGLVVLRSLGKFFGLAGIRLGFVAAATDLRYRLAAALGPWAVARPAIEIGKRALADRRWQTQTRCRLQVDSARLADLLTTSGYTPAGGTGLFQWLNLSQAGDWRERLARHGIQVRQITQPNGIRFGLPGAEHEWQRLAQALNEVTRNESPLAMV